MNRELREDAFRQGNLAPEQASVSVQVAEWAKLPQTKDGYALAADVGSMLLARHQAHENGISTESRQVLACKVSPTGDVLFRSFTVLAPPRNPPPYAPPEAGDLPEPADVARPPTERPQQQQRPLEGSGGRPLVRPGPASSSSSPMPPPTQQPLDFKGTVLHEQMNRDKDTHLVHTVLLARKQGRINTHEELDRHLKKATDPIRVRRMIALTDSRKPPEPTRHGEVRWDDVEGIKGYLPFEAPEMVVGRIVGAFGSSGSAAPSTVRVNMLWALHPEKSADPGFFKRKGSSVVELHVESVEVGLRLVQFWGRGKIRVKLTVSRGVELHSEVRRTVAEVYPEGLDESGRRAHVEWVALELVRVPPETEEWFAPEPPHKGVENNTDDN